MTTTSRVFSASIYPRAAMESAALVFREICEVVLEDDPVGTLATLSLPIGASTDLIDEFGTIALRAAIEGHIGQTKR